MSENESPSERARAVVRGGYDMHVHIDPDFVKRITDDVTLARRCLELGIAGFQLKSHYTSTAERARTVNAAVPGIHAIGAIVLNQAVGGMNALAVEIAARSSRAAFGAYLKTPQTRTVCSANELVTSHSTFGALTRAWADAGAAPAWSPLRHTPRLSLPAATRTRNGVRATN